MSDAAAGLPDGSSHSDGGRRGPGVVRQGGLGVLLQVTTGAVLYAFALIVARATDAEGAGEVLWSLALVNILSLLCRLGFDTTILYFVPRWRTTRSPEKARGLIRTTLTVTFGVGTGVAVAYFLATWGTIDPLLAVSRIAMLALPFQALTQQIGSTGQAHYRVSWLLLQRAAVPGLTTLTVASYWVVAPAMTPETVAALYLTSAAACALTAVLLLRRLVSREYHGALPMLTRGALRPAYSYSLRTWPTAVLNYAFANVDTLLLGVLATAVDAGIYSAAAKTAAFVGYVLLGSNAAFAPHISDAFGRQQLPRLQADYRRMTRFTLIGTMPLAAILILEGDHVLGMFGNQFVVGYTPLVVLCLGHLISAATGAVGYLLGMTGRQTLALVTNVAVFATALVGYAIAIPRWGVMGAAVVTAAAVALRNVGMLLWVVTRVRVRPDPAVALQLTVPACLVLAAHWLAPDVPGLRAAAFLIPFAVWASVALVDRREWLAVKDLLPHGRDR